MPIRFQVDADFYDHPKAIGLSDAATALWTRAGSYSAAKLLDGFVPEHALALLTQSSEEAPGELVRRGLWKRVRGGFQFHEWDERNLTRERVESHREADRDRKRAERGTDRDRYEIDCHACGHSFATVRPDAKFCSARCRKQAHRDKRLVETLAVRTDSSRSPNGIRVESDPCCVASVSESMSVLPDASCPHCDGAGWRVDPTNPQRGPLTPGIRCDHTAWDQKRLEKEWAT